jgi:hypothetical protein
MHSFAVAQEDAGPMRSVRLLVSFPGPSPRGWFCAAIASSRAQLICGTVSRQSRSSRLTALDPLACLASSHCLVLVDCRDHRPRCIGKSLHPASPMRAMPSRAPRELSSSSSSLYACIAWPNVLPRTPSRCARVRLRSRNTVGFDRCLRSASRMNSRVDPGLECDWHGSLPPQIEVDRRSRRRRRCPRESGRS